MEGTMPSGLGWCGHRGRAWLSPLGSHGTSPNLLRLHPHNPGSAPHQLDGSSFSASMAPRAMCSARDRRQLVLLTPSPRVARPAEGRRVGRPRRRRATTGLRLRATSWGNRDSSLRPHFPPHQFPHLSGILSQPPTFQGTGEGGEEPQRGMDRPISRGTSGTLLPLNLSVPICRMGRMKVHFPCAQPAPKKPCPRQSAWPLPWLAAHPARSSAQLGTWTLRVTTILMGSGGHDP